jgi:hypothetical protein
MEVSREKINYADITILGHFNPAILRPRFLLERFGLGPHLSCSLEEVKAASEIKYEKIRWFMLYDRMIVQNTLLDSISDFTAPAYARKYLQLLEYTPLVAAGLNFNIDRVLPNSDLFWNNVKQPDLLLSIVEAVQGTLLEVNSTVRRKGGSFEQVESVIVYRVPDEGKAELRISKTEIENTIRVQANFEVRELEERRSGLDILIDRTHDIFENFRKLISAIPGGDW